MKIWGHKQNLNVKEDDRYRVIWKGSIFWHGRGWLHLGNICLHAEWLFGKKAKFLMLELELNAHDGDAVQLQVGIPHLFNLYLTIEGRWLHRFMPGVWTKSYVRPGEMFFMPVQREMGISYFEGYLRLKLWSNPMEWSSRQPWWWEMSVNLPDLFLGKNKVAHKDLEQGRTVIALPEKQYPASYRLFETTWQRPRWPGEKHFTRVEIEPDEPLPIPGKGENSWDLDDDAIHSGIYPASTVEEGVRKIIESVLRSRRRYGGDNWQPEVKMPAGGSL